MESLLSRSRFILNIERAKDKARKHEIKEQWEKAIGVYERLIADLEQRSEIDNELSLYNRLGDLYLKAGKVSAAVETYEKAANRYAESGFPNNAIALCNKVLRNSPGRTPVYLKLAKLMLERGFTTEAKRNLLEYAERMQRAGQLDQAFTALKEFADLSPDNEEIRLLLAEQLKAAARTDEAREQLSKLYAEVEAHGDVRQVRATLDKMRAIDPEYDVEAAPKPQVSLRKKTSDLVFLDLDEPTPTAQAGASAPPADVGVPEDLAAELEPEKPEAEASDGLDLMYPSAGPAPEVQAIDVRDAEEAIAGAVGDETEAERGVEKPEDQEAVAEPAEGEAQPAELEIERTSFEEETADALASAYQSLEIEPTSLVDGEEDASDAADVDRIATEYLEPEEDVPVLEGLDVEREFASPPEEETPSLDIEPTALEVPEAAEPAPAGQAAAERSGGEADEDVLKAGDVEQPSLAGGEDEPSEEQFAIEVEDLEGEELESQRRNTLGIEMEGDIWQEAEVAEIEVPELDLEASGVEGGGPDAELDLADVPNLDLDAETAAVEEPEAQSAEHEPSRPGATGPAEEVLSTPDVPGLEAQVADDPENVELHRSLAEALLEAGDRDRGIEELEVTLRLLESREEWNSADAIVREILRLEPNSIRHHQKRVELAFHRGDKGALAEAYLGLADALLREGAADRARAVYHRVLEHDPANERAKTGLATLEPEEEEAAAQPTAASQPAAKPHSPLDDEFVDLGALVLEDEEMRVMDTRMRIEEEEPTGDEQRDFEEMLSEFKRGIEANLAEEDWQAHYDLGVAFKEMGLLDEAITEFQKALRAPEGRLKTAEALGLCFFEKAQHSVAATVLRRAVDAEAGGDEAKIGLLYWLGRCEEELGRTEEALSHYQRVFSVDIGFQDVKDRVRQLTGPGR